MCTHCAAIKWKKKKKQRNLISPFWHEHTMWKYLFYVDLLRMSQVSIDARQNHRQSIHLFTVHLI